MASTTLDRRSGDIAHLDIAVCRRCADDLEHCHDELIVHATFEVHCTAAGCVTAPEAHHLIVDCADIGCDCADDGRVGAVAPAIRG